MMTAEERAALSTPLHAALESYFAREKRRPKRSLYYSSDGGADACPRRAWFEINEPGRAESVSTATRLMWALGNQLEDLAVTAIEHAGLLVARQLRVKPVRPSAWAWGSGFVDALRKDPAGEGKTIVEVKSVRSEAFERAKRDRSAMAKGSYVFQASVYWHQRHELVDSGDPAEVTGCELWILDRGGAHEPVVLDLVALGLLLPLSHIIAEETRKAELVFADEPPAQLERRATVRVFKSKSRPPEATAKLPWNCDYCSFRDACGVGESELEVDLEAELVERAVAEAWERWNGGSRRYPETVDVGPIELEA